MDYDKTNIASSYSASRRMSPDMMKMWMNAVAESVMNEIRKGWPTLAPTAAATRLGFPLTVGPRAQLRGPNAINRVGAPRPVASPTS